MNDFDNLTKEPQIEIHRRGIFSAAHIADIHFPVMENPKTQYDILQEQFINIIQPLHLDMIAVDGDLFDHKVLVSSDAAYYASQFVGNLVDYCRRSGTALVLLEGTLSHDANQLKLYTHYMNDSTVDVRIVTSMRFEIIHNARVLCIPELYNADEAYVQWMLHYNGFYDMAIMHGTFEGAVYGDNAGLSRLFRMEDFTNCLGPIIAGHVHKPTILQNHFYYCGSPYAWTFADDHEKSFILEIMDLDDPYHRYYIDRVPIHSFVYRTLSIDEINTNDPRDLINRINEYKEKNHIDYIRIQFNTVLPGSNKLILNDYYRKNNQVTLNFLDPNKELIKKQEEESAQAIEGYEYILDPKLTDEEKFCMYVNNLKGCQYITVDELTNILQRAV